MSDLGSILDRLARKWHEIPGTRLERISTRTLLDLGDQEFLEYWERARADTSDGLRGLGVRGWYHAIYDPWVTGRNILEVGPGIGIDGVRFARAGATMTYVDVSESNLQVVARVSRLMGLPAPCVLHLVDVAALDRLDTDYDAVFACGSLHHMPSGEGKPEFDALARRLKPGGRFVMHAYPFRRWTDEGRLPFDRWGEKTDGAGTPWTEWYDTGKLVKQLRPARFAPIFYCEYRDGAMNCIDLIKTDGHPELGAAAAVPDGSCKAAGAVSLDELKADVSWASSAAGIDTGSVVVTTAPEPWAYAAAAPIHRDRIPPETPRCVLIARAKVDAGRIGIAVATSDGSSIVTEEYLAEDSVEQQCVLEFENSQSAAQLIVRNASATRGASVATLYSLEVYCLAANIR